MKKRILALCAVFALCLFTGCQSAEPSSEASATPEATAEATATAEPTVEPSATPEPEPENTNLLTGLPTLTDEAIGKRPIAVMVNNVDAALPQYGISDADVIFEIPVEADLTRLMAMYGDYTQMGDICSVRSCRYYYPILALGFDAVYVHWGIDYTIALETINRLDIDHIDGQYGLFGRDQNRLNSGYALEHTGVFYGTDLPKALADNSVRSDLKEGYTATAFRFVEAGEVVVPADDIANTVDVQFGANYSVFTFDAERGTYLKSYKSQPHMDAATDEQLAFKNVIVLETDISIRDGEGRKNINWQGGSDYTGYYVSEGRMQPITWSKAGEYEPLKFFDESGAELEINRGKSYIAMTYRGNTTISE